MSTHKSGQFCTIIPGESINGYVAEKKLGKGHYSTVWQTEKDGAKYAIKVFRSSSYYREVFDNELIIMRLVGSLSNDPNSKYVIEHIDEFAFLKLYYDGSLCTGTSIHPCFVMPMYGESLADLLESPEYYNDEFVVALPLPAAKNIMRQILRGLSFLHKNNIVHTDINTANILMRKPSAEVAHINNIEIVISDLGTSYLSDKPSEDGNGTTEYLSPEQRLDIPLTVQTDIWSAGCVFYELVTNSLLFDFSDGSGDGDDDMSSSSDSHANHADDKMDLENSAANMDADAPHVDSAAANMDADATIDKMDMDESESYDESANGGYESDDSSAGDSLAEWDEGYRHFIMMEGLLGPAPYELTKKGRMFFNKHGKLKNNPGISRINIMEILRKEFEYPQNEINGITKFLYCMMQYMPKDRSTADVLLNHPFLNKQKNSKRARNTKSKKK